MDIPAPTTFASAPTITLGVPLGRVFMEPLVGEKNRAPVFLHELGGEKERTTRGPRELFAETHAALASAGHRGPWGAGGIVRETEEAAQFAIAGATWFTFDLSPVIEARADTILLDELDAAIVALEDAGVYPPGWADAYLDREFTLSLRLDDETLARVAVKFGRALAHAEQMQQMIRINWMGKGTAPDVEVSIAAAPVATTRAELLFLALENRRRALGATALAPSLGAELEMGDAFTGDTAIFADFAAIAAASAIKLSLPQSASTASTHLDATEAAPLAFLRELASHQPALFREWLKCAQLHFATVRPAWRISTTEDDIRFLPEVSDDALAATFLDEKRGRQLLLVTFSAVKDELREKLPSFA